MAPGLEAWAKEELWGASLLPLVVRPGGQDQDQFGTFAERKIGRLVNIASFYLSTPEDGQKTRLSESASVDVNFSKIYI